MTIDDDLRELAQYQHAVLSRRQAREAGASVPMLRNRLAGPDWDAPTSRVLSLVGAPRTDEQRLMIAVLDADAAISFCSAGFLWRMPSFGSNAMEVSRERSKRHRSTTAAILHRPSYLPAAHLTEVAGIPVTTLPRTLFDVAGVIHPGRLDQLVERVICRSPSVLNSLHSMLEEIGPRGREGVVAMRAVLAKRPPGYVPTESGLEARFARILADAGEAPLDRQVDVGGHEWIGRIDFVDRELRILFEVDSAIFHKSEVYKAQDRRRDAALRAAGYKYIERIDEEDVWRQPRTALRTVRDARFLARQELLVGTEIDRTRSISVPRTTGGA